MLVAKNRFVTRKVTLFNSIVLMSFLLLTTTGCVSLKVDEFNPPMDLGKHFTMNRKFLSSTYTIRDDAKQSLYYIKSTSWAPGVNYSILDSRGNKIAIIKGKPFNFKQKYSIFKHDKLYAVMRDHFSFNRLNITLDVPGQDGYHVGNSYMSDSFDFMCNGRNAASISRRISHWKGDSYSISVAPGHDEVLFIAAAVVLDLVRGDNSERNDPPG